MKTQINTLRSGNKNQILNTEIDYSQLKPATSHIGHSGSNHLEVASIWSKVIQENPEIMLISIKGLELELKANWSGSRKSVSYWGCVSKEDLEEKFHLAAAKKHEPYITIQSGNTIMVGNGKKSYAYVCPSLITIL